MSRGTLEIHSENILPIIKKWLYSDKDIFVRELISNACDAIEKVRILQKEGVIPKDGDPFRVDLTILKEERKILIADNGIGMTADEVKKYIAQIAFSGAEDFVQAYQAKSDDEAFIGHFGLGFYSAYMVADRVEIDTLSWQEGAEPAHWECDGSSEYSLEKGSREKRGTAISLHLGESGEEFLDAAHLKKILQRYCSFLAHPIFLNGQQINGKDPLWMKPASECTKEEYLAFYRQLYPLEPDPLFWVHLNVDYPFHVQGILYFPKIARDVDWNKSAIQLYCNRVFVSDNCKDLIPQYLMMLKGAIDSPDIPLNVSRSYLQMDRTVRQLSTHISKKVADSLGTFFRTDRDGFLACWEDVSPVIKLGAIEDGKFYERVKEFLLWKTISGEWLTAEEYLSRNSAKTGDTILYTREEHHSPHFNQMYAKKGIDVLIAPSSIDNYLFSFLEGKISPAKFSRVDGSLGDSLIDKEREQTILDDQGKTAATHLSEWIRSHLSEEELEVEAKSLSDDAVPAFLLIDESQRRMREYFLSMDPQQAMHLGGKKTFVVNTNNPLIRSIQKLHSKEPALAKEMVEEIYGLSLLSQKEIQPQQLHPLVQRTHQLLETLVARLTDRDGS